MVYARTAHNRTVYAAPAVAGLAGMLCDIGAELSAISI